jgi:hypothetical protein
VAGGSGPRRRRACSCRIRNMFVAMLQAPPFPLLARKPAGAGAAAVAPNQQARTERAAARRRTRRQARPAWVGAALAASSRTLAVPASRPAAGARSPPGRGTGGRASMHGASPTGTEPGRPMVAALATSIPDRPCGFPCWLLQGNRPERRGNAGFSERAGSCGRAETEAIPCIFPVIREMGRGEGRDGFAADCVSNHPVRCRSAGFGFAATGAGKCRFLRSFGAGGVVAAMERRGSAASIDIAGGRVSAGRNAGFEMRPDHGPARDVSRTRAPDAVHPTPAATAPASSSD